MEDITIYLATLDWKSYLLLVIGLVLGALLREGGKDLYNRISKKFFPHVEQEKQAQIVVRLVNGAPESVTANTTEISPASVERIAQLSYSKIMDTINAAPPMQQESVRKSFIGIQIQWDASFYNGSEESDDKFKVWLQTADEMIGLISCEVSATDYPELKVLSKGAPIRIIGKISKILEISVVELTDVRLEILG